MIGTLLNERYKLIRMLGSGGFGQTFVAEDTKQVGNPSCVIKQFKPANQSSTYLEIARRLFMKEVEVLRKLGSHDRIPTLLDNFEENGQFYLVQEYVEGRSLLEELAISSTLTESEVVTLLKNVLEVLVFIHQNNVIHRDIKPGNLIRRQRDRKFVVIDFGAVKEINTQISQQLSQTQLTVGIATQGYGPTEQLAGKPRFNSDLYALGMTAIQCLTGLNPAQLPTHPTTGEVVWHDRSNVSPWLTVILDKMVRYHFNERFQSAVEVLHALSLTASAQPTNMQRQIFSNAETLIPPTEFSRMATDLTGLPVELSGQVQSTRNPLRKRIWATLSIGMTSLMATGLVSGMRSLGWLQPLELVAYDRLVQATSSSIPDPRIVVVGITEADIQKQKRFPLADGLFAETIQKLQQYQPRAIGLDVLRDIPQEPGRSALLSTLKAPNVVVITNLGTPTTPAPPGVSFEQVGFNDVPLDPDSVVRRNLLFAHNSDEEEPFYSFALRLAALYLKSDNIFIKPSVRDTTIAQLGKAELLPLATDSGGYEKIDDRGYQILLRYRGQHAISTVSLSDVLQGTIPPEQIRDKVVLVGTTAPNAKDLFLTPYSSLEQEAPRLPGVVLHAQMVSQLLSAASGEQPLIWLLSEPLELLWIGVWAVSASTIAWLILQRPLLVFLGQGVLLVCLLGSSYGFFLQGGWFPIVAPAIALGLAATGIVIYRMTQQLKILKNSQL